MVGVTVANVLTLAVKIQEIAAFRIAWMPKGSELRMPAVVREPYGGHVVVVMKA